MAITEKRRNCKICIYNNGFSHQGQFVFCLAKSNHVTTSIPTCEFFKHESEVKKRKKVDRFEEMREAAEFEALVAAKIADMHPHYTCTGSSICERFKWDEDKAMCKYATSNCILWKARLAVEEELNK